jgi:Ca2+-binding RTX toxin-like protein
LTADGRVLVPYLNAANEIAEVLLDSRENVIHGTPLGEVLTAQVGSTNLFGEGGEGRLLGQAGSDTLVGGAGKDTLLGRTGEDTLQGSEGLDRLEGLKGGLGEDIYLLHDINDTLFPDTRMFDTAIEFAGDGVDTVRVAPLNNLTVGKDGYTLAANIGNGFD